MDVKEMLNTEIAKMRKALKRETSLFTTVGNCKELLEHIEELKTAKKPIPEDVKFSSYDDWEKMIEKKQQIAQRSLEKLDKYKELIKVYEYYIENQAA